MNAIKPALRRVRCKSIAVGSIELPHVAEIVQAAQAVEDGVGVYFLMRKSASGKSLEIVYVGQSTNVHGRVAQHWGRKRFDCWSYIECRLDQLDLIESLYIHWLRPDQNARRSTINNRVKSEPDDTVAPLSRTSVAHLLKAFPPTSGWAAAEFQT